MRLATKYDRFYSPLFAVFILCALTNCGGKPQYKNALVKTDPTPTPTPISTPVVQKFTPTLSRESWSVPTESGSSKVWSNLPTDMVLQVSAEDSVLAVSAEISRAQQTLANTNTEYRLVINDAPLGRGGFCQMNTGGHEEFKYRPVHLNCQTEVKAGEYKIRVQYRVQEGTERWISDSYGVNTRRLRVIEYPVATSKDSSFVTGKAWSPPTEEGGSIVWASLPTDMAMTFSTKTSNLLIEAEISRVQQSLADKISEYRILVDGTETAAGGLCQVSTGDHLQFNYKPIHLSCQVHVLEGSHTVQVQYRVPDGKEIWYNDKFGPNTRRINIVELPDSQSSTLLFTKAWSPAFETGTSKAWENFPTDMSSVITLPTRSALVIEANISRVQQDQLLTNSEYRILMDDLEVGGKCQINIGAHGGWNFHAVYLSCVTEADQGNHTIRVQYRVLDGKDKWLNDTNGIQARSINILSLSL